MFFIIILSFIINKVYVLRFVRSELQPHKRSEMIFEHPFQS